MVGTAKLGKEEPSDVFHVIQEVRKIPIPVPSRDWVHPPKQTPMPPPFKLLLSQPVVLKPSCDLGAGLSVGANLGKQHTAVLSVMLHFWPQLSIGSALLKSPMGLLIPAEHPSA